MKNIAIPLLMASSAQAQRTKVQRMAQDRAVPKPILIADDWHDGDCVDAGSEVATKYGALVAAEEKLAEATGLRAALVEAVEEAATAKTEAIAAVVEQDVSMAAAVESDDAANELEITKKAALDEKTIAETMMIAAAEAALAAKEAADEAYSTAEETKEAMDTALTAAEAHEDHEQEQTADWTGKVSGAESDYNTKNGAISGLEDLYNDEVDLYNPLLATTTEKLALWNDYTALTTQLVADLVAVATVLDNTQASGLAKTLLTEETTMTDTELSELNTKEAAWTTKSKAAVLAMYKWINYTDDFSTAIGTAQLCSGATAVDKTGGSVTSEATCAAECTALLAWGGTDALPTGTTFATMYNSGVPTGCTGYDVNTNDWSICNIYSVAKVTAAAGAANDSANTVCKSRNKTDRGEAAAVAIAAATTSVTEYTEMTDKLTAWATQNMVIDDAQEAVDLATEYQTQLTTEKTTAETTYRDVYEGEYNVAYGLSTAKYSQVTSTKSDWETKVTDTATALSLLNSYKASLAAQEAEEAAQDALVELAEADVAAQTETVSTLQGIAEEADTTNGDAIEASEEATSAKETAQEEYDSAVEAAEGTAEALVTPLETLAGLRGTALERTENLIEALANEAGQEQAISTEQDKVDEAAEAHLAAIVACKEARFDQYAAALAGEEQARQDKLDAIEEWIDENPPKAAGTVGARCEKAVSNGTFRPKRNEETCTGETVCCGASKIAVGNLIMTVETCQNDTTTSFSYVAPRGPMETEPPAGKTVPFQCIDGAQKLAAAASALAAAVYMLA